MKDKLTIIINTDAKNVDVSILRNQNRIKIKELTKEMKLTILSLISFTHTSLLEDFMKNMIDIPVNVEPNSIN